MENYILLAIVSALILYFGYKVWEAYRPKKTLTCMDANEVRDGLNKGDQIVLIDVRDNEAYSNRHIEGAINIPLPELKKGLKKIGKENKVVIVCYSGADRSKKGAVIAAKMGFNTTWLCGGTNDWLGLNEVCPTCK